MRKLARLITAAAGITTLTAGIPSIAAASVTAPVSNPIVVKKPFQDYLDERFSNGLHAGDNFSIAMNDIFTEGSGLEYTIIVQNDSVADVKEWRDFGSFRVGLKKQGTTMVNVIAKRPGEQAVVHERFRLTAAAAIGLDANGDGAGIDDVVKYFRAYPERFNRTEDYRNLLQAAVSSTVTAPNRAPLSPGNAEQLSLFAGSSISLNMNDYFRDEDGDLLTYTLQVQPQNGGGAANVTLSQDGTLAIEGISQSPNPVTATVTASDGVLTASHSFNITVTRVNHAPVAMSGTLSLMEDTSAAGTLVGTDADGDALTYRIEKQGSRGIATITNASTGEFTYVPHPNANGIDKFEFIVNDGTADSAKAEIIVTIEPVEDHIVVDPNNQLGINNDGIITLRKNQSAAIDMTRVFSNPDGKEVDYSYTDGYGLDINMEQDGYLIVKADEYTTGSSFQLGLRVKEAEEGNEWFTHYITINVGEGDDIENQMMAIDPQASLDLPLADYFALGGGNNWSMSVSNKDEATGSLNASVSGTTLNLRGLADGASKLVVSVDDGHGGVVSDEFIVFVGNWIPHDIGNVYIFSGEGNYYNSSIYLDEIFYDATEYRVTEIDSNILTFYRPLNEWFPALPYENSLNVSLAEPVPTTMTIEAKNEFGQTATYIVHMVWNSPPVYVGGHEPIIIRKGETYMLDMLNPIRFEDFEEDELEFSAGIDDNTTAEVREPSGAFIPIYGKRSGGSHIFLEAYDGVNHVYEGVPIGVLDVGDEYIIYDDIENERIKSIDISDKLTDMTGPYTVSLSENSLGVTGEITGSTLTLSVSWYDAQRQTDMITVTVSDGENYKEFNVYVYIPIPTV